MRRRHSLQARLTLLYGGLFLGSGVLLLVITNVGARSDISVPVLKPSSPFGTRPTPILIRGDEGADRLAVSSAFALAVMVVISLVLGWWIAGRILRPLRTMTSTAREISATNLHERLGLSGPADELRELGDTLDDLFARLEASFESQRHFVANASHELRTPLTAERALLQVAMADPDATAESLRAACEEVVELGAQQERLIDALLTLAVGERGVDRREPFDLATLVERAVDERRHELERRGLSLRTSIDAAVATGDVRLVESLVTNVIDNAIRHNVTGADDAGFVEVSTGTTDSGAKFTVSNTGPTIAPDDVGRLFEPFQRLGDARVGQGDGHGLGLAITGAIADAHGATVVARARPTGGLDLEITFPGLKVTPS